jgi:putative colanic acid biosynthesis glycosyltransferase
MNLNLSQRITISIVTITYNDLNGLKSTVSMIDKKISSLYLNTEHIIINGRPGDKTEAFINSTIQNRLIKTILISEADDGIYDAMNKGVEISTGDFVIFINSGDLIVNNYDNLDIFELLREELNNNDSAGIAFSCNYNIFNNRIKITPRYINKRLPKMPTLHQGILYKRSVLNKIKFSLKYKICGDFENFCAIFMRNNFTTYDFIISELIAGGVSTNKPLLLFSESRSIFKKYFIPNYLRILLYDLRLMKSILQFQFIYRTLSFLHLFQFKKII